MDWVYQVYEILSKSPDPMKIKLPNVVKEFRYGPLRFVLLRSPNNEFIWVYIYEDGRFEIYSGEIGKGGLTIDDIFLKKAYGELNLIIKK